MAHQNHSQSEVPEELIHDHHAGWEHFTRYVFIGCVAVVAALLFGLLLIKV